jgi:hypothetical protein
VLLAHCGAKRYDVDAASSPMGDRREAMRRARTDIHSRMITKPIVGDRIDPDLERPLL